MNKYYEFSDGFFTYFINISIGEKKFKLEPNDELVNADLDDFIR